jgi:predicted RNase H-like nuclease (RuvC/YqgF family)
MKTRKKTYSKLIGEIKSLDRIIKKAKQELFHIHESGMVKKRGNYRLRTTVSGLEQTMEAKSKKRDKLLNQLTKLEKVRYYVLGF